MKEKRVDIYLALAGLFQIMLIGLLGYLATAMISGTRNTTAFYFTVTGIIALVGVVYFLYRKAFQLVNKTKSKKS